MPRVQEFFAKGRLTAVISRPGKWEFQLAGAGRLPLEGRFWIEPGQRYVDNFCALLLSAASAEHCEIVVKATAPISSLGPAVVDCMRVVRRDGKAQPTAAGESILTRQVM